MNDQVTKKKLTDRQRRIKDIDDLVRSNWVSNEPDLYDDKGNRIYLTEEDWILVHISHGEDIIYECKLAGIKPSIRMLLLNTFIPHTDESLAKNLIDRAMISLKTKEE